MDKDTFKFFLIIFVIWVFALILVSRDVEAAELYMPNSSDGFLTLTEEPCRIPTVATDYPNKALNADDQGNEMEGCWRVAPHPEGTLAAAYSVFMYEEGNANVGTFGLGLFSTEKKRWTDTPKVCDHCGTM